MRAERVHGLLLVHWFSGLRLSRLGFWFEGLESGSLPALEERSGCEGLECVVAGNSKAILLPSAGNTYMLPTSLVSTAL